MKMLTVTAVTLIALQAQATQIPFRDLTNLVADADHILVGIVDKVGMSDAKENQITNETARTGPGSDNLIRLYIKVPTNGVVTSSAHKMPDTIVIPLWQEWHDTLGNRKREVKGKTFVFLLKGNDFAPVYHGLFMRPISERAEIERLLKEKKVQNQPPEGTR